MHCRFAFLPLTLAAAMTPWMAAAAPAASQGPSLTLFSGLGFQGRQVTYRPGGPGRVSPSFKARSAYGAGAWILCEGAGAGSRCQTVEGPAALLKLSPSTVRLAGEAPPASRAAPVRKARSPVPPARPGAARARPVQVAAQPSPTRSKRTSRRPDRRWPGQLQASARRPAVLADAALEAAASPEPAAPVGDRVNPVAYSCRGGRSLTVLFDQTKDTAEIRDGGQEPVVLAGTGGSEGFRYESWGRAFYGDGDHAAYQIGGSDRLDCWAERASPGP